MAAAPHSGIGGIGGIGGYEQGFGSPFGYENGYYPQYGYGYGHGDGIGGEYCPPRYNQHGYCQYPRPHTTYGHQSGYPYDQFGNPGFGYPSSHSQYPSTFPTGHQGAYDPYGFGSNPLEGGQFGVAPQGVPTSAPPPTNVAADIDPNLDFTNDIDPVVQVQDPNVVHVNAVPVPVPSDINVDVERSNQNQGIDLPVTTADVTVDIPENFDNVEVDQTTVDNITDDIGIEGIDSDTINQVLQDVNPDTVDRVIDDIGQENINQITTDISDGDVSAEDISNVIAQLDNVDQDDLGELIESIPQETRDGVIAELEADGTLPEGIDYNALIESFVGN